MADDIENKTAQAVESKIENKKEDKKENKKEDKKENKKEDEQYAKHIDKKYILIDSEQMICQANQSYFNDILGTKKATFGENNVRAFLVTKDNLKEFANILKKYKRNFDI